MPRFRHLAFETLEVRQLLAADLELVSVQLTNAIGELTGATPVVGEKIYAVAHYRITDLTGADVYDISWDLDGVTTSQFGFFGFPGTDVDLFWFHGGWIAQPGASHVLTVTVDSGGAVAESDELNNSITLPSFTPLAPTTLPNKFVTPLPGTQNEDWVLGGYVDVDPRSFADDPVNFFIDYQGNTNTTRDFHNGLDFDVANFAAQDGGMQVLAAADGTVMEIRDGFFDRETQLTFGDAGNYVFIDHGNDWVSQYYHLRSDSITVGVGEAVTAGQVIGLVGSSGNSGGPHVHFEIQHNKTPVDPFTAPTDYFVSPLPYIFDPSLSNNLLAFGVTNDIYDGVHTTGLPPDFGGPPLEHFRERVSDIDTFPTTPQEIYAYATFTSVEAGDTWKAQLFRPDGSLVNNFGPATFFENRALDGGWYRPGFTENIPGTWRVDFLFNDVKVDERFFEVGAAAPEMRVFDVSLSDEVYLIDGRTTPIEFGASDFDGDDDSDGRDFLLWQLGFGIRSDATRGDGDATKNGAVGSEDLAVWSADFGVPEPTKTFRVENHGYADLTVGSVQLPAGYVLDESLSATIAAGASDTFRVRRDIAINGLSTGDIQINSNDADEAAFTFAVEGEISAPLVAASTAAMLPFDEALLEPRGDEDRSLLAIEHTLSEYSPDFAAERRTLAANTENGRILDATQSQVEAGDNSLAVAEVVEEVFERWGLDEGSLD